MTRIRALSLLLHGVIMAGPAWAVAPAGVHASVVGVMANAGGTVHAAASGSGVVVAPGLVATNCHVLRGATVIAVGPAGRMLPARLHAGDADKDVCLLAVPGLRSVPVRIRTSHALAVGATVRAVGYPAGGPQVAQDGRVEALHAFRDGMVIQTSAPFARGASGGGLFTGTGELVGLLTFKVPDESAFHFAVPVDWIDSVARAGRTDAIAADACAFWERTPDQRTPFLSAVWHEANRQWRSLYHHCLQWLTAEPGNEEARRAMLRAITELLAR